MYLGGLRNARPHFMHSPALLVDDDMLALQKRTRSHFLLFGGVAVARLCQRGKPLFYRHRRARGAGKHWGRPVESNGIQAEGFGSLAFRLAALRLLAFSSTGLACGLDEIGICKGSPLSSTVLVVGSLAGVA